MVSPRCERAGASSTLSSQQTPCRILRRHARAARACAGASSSLSCHGTSSCSPDMQSVGAQLKVTISHQSPSAKVSKMCYMSTLPSKNFYITSNCTQNVE